MSYNYFDIPSAILSLSATALGVLNNPITWPISLIGASVSFAMYYKANMLAHLAKESFYMGVMIYGWRNWTKKVNARNQTKKIEKMDPTLFYFSMMAIFVAGILSGYFLKVYYNSASPYQDSITTFLSMFAIVLTSKRIIQCWIVWLFCDAISISLFLNYALYASATKCIVYTVVACIGYWHWNKIMKKQNQPAINENEYNAFSNACGTSG
ncbi:MAG TPA: nicotinamide riboside transporter PnuC [Gammaproteobacteria bacterium]|nr:nicotinamide riboside transporter PnuC [Gammaproteobacteria bacterium]